MKPFLHTRAGSVTGILRLQSFPNSQGLVATATEPQALLHMEQDYYTFLGSSLELASTTTTIILMSHTPQSTPHRTPGSRPLKPRELQWLNCFRFLLELSESSSVTVSLLLT